MNQWRGSQGSKAVSSPPLKQASIQLVLRELSRCSSSRILCSRLEGATRLLVGCSIRVMSGTGAKVAVAVAIACAFAPGAAAAAWSAAESHGFKRLEAGDLKVPVITDGVRYAAYQRRQRGKTRILDTKRGTSYDARTPNRSCELTAVAAGLLLWRCEEARGSYPVLLDIKARRRLTVRGVDALFADVRRRAAGSPYNIELYEVGRHWIGGSLGFFYGYHSDEYGTFYLNWRTGDRRYDQPDNPKQIANVDRPNLIQALCAPLHRVRDLSYDQPIYEPYAYAPPFGVRGGGLTRLFLERCGHSPRLLARCRAFNGCNDSFQLGAGLVSWTDYRTAYLYDIARRRRERFSTRAFRANGPESGDSVLDVSHTRNTIFVSVPIAGTTPDGMYIQVRWRLYARRLR
jgi:hypothetical protein